MASASDQGTLDAKERKAVGAALQEQLIDLIDLGLLAKQAHWNVVGPNFRPVHQHFDELAEAYQGFVDEVAERINALDLFPNGQVNDVASATPFAPLPAGPVRDLDIVGAFADRLETAIGRARKRIAELDALDLVTQDMIIGMVDELEKQRWMLRAQLR